MLLQLTSHFLVKPGRSSPFGLVPRCRPPTIALPVKVSSLVQAAALPVHPEGIPSPGVSEQKRHELEQTVEWVFSPNHNLLDCSADPPLSKLASMTEVRTTRMSQVYLFLSLTPLVQGTESLSAVNCQSIEHPSFYGISATSAQMCATAMANYYPNALFATYYALFMEHFMKYMASVVGDECATVASDHTARQECSPSRHSEVDKNANHSYSLRLMPRKSFQSVDGWSREEDVRFTIALELYGCRWEKITEHVGTRDIDDIKEHYRLVTKENGINRSSSLKRRRSTKPKHNYALTYGMIYQHGSDDDSTVVDEPIPKRRAVVHAPRSTPESPEARISERLNSEHEPTVVSDDRPDGVSDGAVVVRKRGRPRKHKLVPTTVGDGQSEVAGRPSLPIREVSLEDLPLEPLVDDGYSDTMTAYFVPVHVKKCPFEEIYDDDDEVVIVYKEQINDDDDVVIVYKEHPCNTEREIAVVSPIQAVIPGLEQETTEETTTTAEETAPVAKRGRGRPPGTNKQRQLQLQNELNKCAITLS